MKVKSEIIFFSEAKRLGKSRYFTGKKCSKGHLSERHVANRTCVECQNESHRQKRRVDLQKNNERMKKYKAKNPAKIKEIAARFYQNNKDRIQLRVSLYRELNLEKIRERERKYKKCNSEKAKEAVRRWHRNNPQSIKAIQANRRARRIAAEGTHTAEDVRNIFNSQNGRCAVCFIPLTKASQRSRHAYHVDHVIPLSRGGSNWPSNLQLLCAKDNISKKAKLMHEWLGENYIEDIKNKKFYYLKCEAVTLDDQ